MIDAEYYIEYECINLFTEKSFKTRDYLEADGYYKEGWDVIEHHITKCLASVFTSTYSRISTKWNDNPAYQKPNQ